MRLVGLVATGVLLLVASDAGAQGSRYDQPPGGSAVGGNPAELPFGNTDIRSQFEATDLSRSEPPKPIESAPPVSVPAAQPAPPSVAPPRTYGGASTYGGGASVAASNSASAGTSGDYAESLMRDALTPPPGTQLAGTKVYLADVVRAAGSRRQQSAGINAYWDLCSSTSDYYLSLYERAELQRLATRLGQSATIRSALTTKQARQETALTAARASQLRLAAIMGRSQTAPLPLPGDMPLTGVYHTRYSQNFAAGGPREAAELNQLLPKRHRELLGAATAVGEAEDFFHEVVRRAESDQQDQGRAVVNALELLALNRRAFVQISRDYNQRITRYTELARPGQLRTERLVSMLIKPTNLASRPTPPPTPTTRRSSQADPPSTFVDELENPLQAATPRMDMEVLPAGAVEAEAPAAIGALPNHNMVERVETGERSVLLRSEQDAGQE
jgi:hypothetical protein